MSGKTDSLSFESATAKVAESMPHAAEILQQLDEILRSPAFRNSRRSQEFLAHVVHHALDGDFDSLRERIIGIEIFHRSSDYDTNDDSIVRVTASDVRRRLNLFYAGGELHTFQIGLPPGSYLPSFARPLREEPELPEMTGPDLVESVSVEPPSLAPVENTRSLEVPRTAPARNGAAVIDPDAGELQATSDVQDEGPERHLSRGWLPRLSWQTWVAATMLLVLSFASGWLLRSVVHGHAAYRHDVSNYGFYRDLLGPMASDNSMRTEVVLSNPRLFLYRGDSSGPAPSPPEAVIIPVPTSLTEALNQGANDTQANFPHHSLVLDGTDYTGLGEAKTAVQLAHLMAMLQRPLSLSEARFLNWDTARTEHLILLGAPHMSSFAESTLAGVNFTFEHDDVRNLKPLPGERAVYTRQEHGDAVEDYGMIWMSRSPSGARILLIAGLTSAGTAGVGEFFTDPAKMRLVYEKLRAQGPVPENWQVLVHVSAREGIPVETSLVALRTYPAQ